MSPAEEKRIHQAFIVSLAIKAADAILELAVALLLAVVDVRVLSNAVVRLVAKELVHHPEDRVAAWVARAAEGFSIDAKTFAVLYLAIHGVIKLILVVGCGATRPGPIRFRWSRSQPSSSTSSTASCSPTRRS